MGQNVIKEVKFLKNMFNEKTTTIVKCIIHPNHIDDYGHLNNAFYSCYFEKGRIALQKKFGLEDSVLAEKGIGFLVSSATYKYKKQVPANAKVEIHSRFVPYDKGVRIYIDHAMCLNGDIVASARTEHVFVNLKNNKPIKPLDRLIQKITYS